jgi:hypothetical protein
VAKQQSEIVAAAQRVAKAEARRGKVEAQFKAKLAEADQEVAVARAELKALVGEGQ